MLPKVPERDGGLISEINRGHTEKYMPRATPMMNLPSSRVHMLKISVRPVPKIRMRLVMIKVILLPLRTKGLTISAPGIAPAAKSPDTRELKRSSLSITNLSKI